MGSQCVCRELSGLRSLSTYGRRAQCTEYTVHCKQYSVQCELYSFHCTLNTVPYTLYIKPLVVMVETFRRSDWSLLTTSSSPIFMTFYEPVKIKAMIKHVLLAYNVKFNFLCIYHFLNFGLIFLKTHLSYFKFLNVSHIHHLLLVYKLYTLYTLHTCTVLAWHGNQLQYFTPVSISIVSNSIIDQYATAVFNCSILLWFLQQQFPI